MGQRIEYSEGDIIGPNGLIYIKDVDPYVNPKNGRRERKAEFECPHCEGRKHFETRIIYAKNGHTKSCGCLSEKASIETIKKYNSLHKDPWNKVYPEVGSTVGDNGVIYLGETDIERWTPSGGKIRYCRFLCPSCKKEFVAIMENVSRNLTKGCGCVLSHGERKVADILSELNIKYEKQKKFDDFKSEKGWPYRFDFYLTDFNILIEYNGSIHYKYDKNGTIFNKESYEDRVRRDAIKAEYAKRNNIPLLVIPYTDYNILSESYLMEKINEICVN